VPVDAATIRSLPATRRWVYALKPASWGKLLVPTVLGLGLGLSARESIGLHEVGAAVWGILYTTALLAFVVLLNDWGDREIDALKRRMFPGGCSPKTIPDGILPARALLFAGLASGVVAVLVGVVGGVVLDVAALPAASALALSVFVAYTLPPIQLNYRGGGELLEMLGVGLVLPLLMVLAVADEGAFGSGVLLGRFFVVLPGFCSVAFASAVASGLADELSDREGGKRTFATMFGNATARAMVEAALFAGGLWWGICSALPSSMLGGLLGSELEIGVVLRLFLFGAAVAAISSAVRLRSVGRAATSCEFAAIGRYKLVLHRAIQIAGLSLALGAAVAP
jgi:1,4-dihydroxy-2-naphthoate octaprenyltransferase